MWRTLHAWAAILWVAAIIVQVFLAGQAIANLGGSGDFTTHIGFGYTIGIVQLVTLILAFPARMSGRDKWISAGILGAYIVQTLLPGLKSVSPLISALHPPQRDAPLRCQHLVRPARLADRLDARRGTGGGG
jgi:hypothetical protein